MNEAIQTELLALTKTKAKPGETAEAFTLRVMKKVNTLVDGDDQVWESMSDEAQQWMNDNTIANENGNDLALLDLDPKAETGPEPELPLEPEEDPSTDPEPEEESVEMSASAAKTKKAKAPKKEKPVKVAKVKAEKPAKVAKVKAPKAATNGNGAKKEGNTRGRKPLFPDDGVIQIIATENPHRKGSHRDVSFSKLKNGMTVAQAIKAGVPRQQVWSLWHREVISVEA